MSQTYYKRYVDTDVRVTKEGKIVPTALYWFNYKPVPDRYVIDRIEGEPVREHSRVGGTGLCYKIIIRGEMRKLFLEEGDVFRFFMESKKP